MTRTGPRARLVSATLTSQVVSSIGNFTVAVLLARRSEPDEFGRYALILAVYYTATELARALAGDPVYGRTLRTALDGQRVVVAMTGVALLMSTALGVPAVLAWSSFGSPIAALTLAFPLMMSFEGLRVASFATRRPWTAALVDAVWTGAFLLFATTVATTPHATFVAWLAPPMAIGGVALISSRGALAVHPISDWWRETARESASLVADLFIGRFVVHLTLIAVTVVAGVAAVGAIRGAELLFAPAMVAAFGVRNALLAGGARSGSAQPWVDARRVGAAAVVGLTIVGFVGRTDPAGLVTTLLGQTSAGALGMLPLTGLSFGLSIFLVVARVPFQLQSATAAFTRARAWCVPLLVVPPLVLAGRYGATGALLGFTIGRACSVIAVGTSAERRFSSGRRSSTGRGLDRVPAEAGLTMERIA